jgi:hypothetical protein
MLHPWWWRPNNVSNMEVQTKKELEILERTFIASCSNKKNRDGGPQGRATRLQLGEKEGFQPSKLLAKRAGKVDKEMDHIDSYESTSSLG